MQVSASDQWTLPQNAGKESWNILVLGLSAIAAWGKVGKMGNGTKLRIDNSITVLAVERSQV